MADQILKTLTPETKSTILRLKFETPDDKKIMGIEYYQAVIRDGVKTYSDLVDWRRLNPVNGIVERMP